MHYIPDSTKWFLLLTDNVALPIKVKYLGTIDKNLVLRNSESNQVFMAPVEGSHLYDSEDDLYRVETQRLYRDISRIQLALDHASGEDAIDELHFSLKQTLHQHAYLKDLQVDPKMSELVKAGAWRIVGMTGNNFDFRIEKVEAVECESGEYWFADRGNEDSELYATFAQAHRDAMLYCFRILGVREKEASNILTRRQALLNELDRASLDGEQAAKKLMEAVEGVAKVLAYTPDERE